MPGTKRTKKTIPTQDDDVPSSSDDDVEESSCEYSGDEEEETEEDDTESSNLTTPPPPPPPSKKVKLPRPTVTAATTPSSRPTPPARKKNKVVIEEEEMEEEETAPLPNYTIRKEVKRGRKKVADKTVPPITISIKKKSSNNDYEVQMDTNSKVTDMSVSAPKFSKNKMLLDERHWVRIGSVSYKSKGVLYDQLFIGRDPAKGEVTKDGSAPKPFQMGIPIRCLEPLRKSCEFLCGNKEGTSKDD